MVKVDLIALTTSQFGFDVRHPRSEKRRISKTTIRSGQNRLLFYLCS